MRIHRNSQAGTSLFEVLIALFILGVGLLGVISLQAESLKLNQQASSSTQALLLANDMAERIRIAKAVCDSQTRPPEDPNVTCVGWNKVEPYIDVAAWKASVKDALPGGKGEIENAPIDPALPLRNEINIDITYQQIKLNSEGPAVVDDVKEITYQLVTRI